MSREKPKVVVTFYFNIHTRTRSVALQRAGVSIKRIKVLRSTKGDIMLKIYGHKM